MWHQRLSTARACRVLKIDTPLLKSSRPTLGLGFVWPKPPLEALTFEQVLDELWENSYLPVSVADEISRISQLAHTSTNWVDIAKQCYQLWFDGSPNKSRLRELCQVLRLSSGNVLPLPTRPRQTLPILMRHTYERLSVNRKDFYYLLWYMGEPQRQGGGLMPVQCLNGPYTGETFARLDEAVRANMAWAWCTSEPRTRSVSLLLGVNRKDLFCLHTDGHWLSFRHFNKLSNLPDDVLQVRDDGIAYRADLHPFAAFLPDGCIRSMDQQVSVTWSQAHRSCIATGEHGPVQCCCPDPACYHRPMDTLNTKQELRALLRNPADPHSLIQPHPRRLQGHPFWVRSESDDPNRNWYDAIAYTVQRVY